MGNVDVNEIEKFSGLAAKWWDLSGEFKPLHDINPLRSDFIQQHLPQGLKGMSLLDVGCGGGILAEAMVQRGAVVTGIDMADASLEVARLHGLESGLKAQYECISAEEHATTHPAAYDVVTCLEMLEHVPDPASVIRSVAHMVKPGGYAFFSTLNRNPKSYLMAILGAEYLLKMVPKGTHDYQKFIKPSELMRYIDSTSLSIQDCTGLHFNPLTQTYYLSPKNIDVNYIVACHKPL
ncbi:bifunctional 2-polyprenyl-6-hydroxyphenol methylase/3-demethylubiquinol 3-O-methyltransferase UbiG [Opacimonas viscosa]|uniref:Ubiquinone biosynthesis O-methyltransferase n=1 Tax=Opacimonas viscosa TaxID=2961944 RepID=A0AA42BNH3_9ALTE|nr:bifunctional 2-polyprenyl-6-hydroxyphenol methylase/3-demethylubiquinol 3-O-methyltransferase UbiG [Opacimonas viscosa]MCP3427421.1 bifunctional 2-polyprenyl-6-hydroxyphenol methylase/3-demethylubiquinol 3-O-methyltransferase UbiG [Opacimonas viscosa]